MELDTQNVILAQNKLLTQQIEALTKQIGQLPQQFQQGGSQKTHQAHQVQQVEIANRKKRPIMCKTRRDLNRTSKQITKVTEVAQVQISLMAEDYKIIMHILVSLSLLLRVLLTTLMQVLQIGFHNNNSSKLSRIECQRWKIL